MAGAFEQTIIVGNVGRDPELRYTQSGRAVCDFSVAVTTRWRDSQTNEQKEKTSWYRCTTWAGLAEVCNKYVKKGMSVLVTGTVEANAYMGQDGQPRASLDLTARDVQFLTRVDGDGGNYDNGGGNYNNQPQDLDDIPF